jgi:hypothetical protein
MPAQQFTVGVSEKHTIEVNRNWLLGTVRVMVDGVKIKTKINIVGGTKTIQVTVGEQEKHDVVITARIPVLFPAFRSWHFEAEADGKAL